MDKKIKIINLKEESYFIEQYVNLRNSYIELLLTSTVTVCQTKKWLKKNDIEVRGLAKDNILLGIAILYLNREGEIAFFVKYPAKGIGSKLLKIIEEVAKEKKLKFIWGWVRKDNLIAQQVFEKERFVKSEISGRRYRNTIKEGIKYKKVLDNSL